MSTTVNPQKVDELAAEFTRLKRVLESRERAIHREISQLIHSTNAKYDESYVRATTREMESLLREIQTLTASITERLQGKSTVLKQAAHQFRRDEEGAKRRSRGVKMVSFKTKLGRSLPSFYRIARRAVSTKNHQYKVINSILGKAKNKFTQLKMDDPFASLRNKVNQGPVTMKQVGSSIVNKGTDFVEAGKRNIEVSQELGDRLFASFKESWKGRYGTSVQDYIARELYYKNKGRLEGLWNFGKHTVEGVIDTGKFVFEHSTPVMIYKEIREPGYHKQKIDEHVERAKYIYADPKGYAKEVWEVVKQEMIQPVVDDFDEQYIHGDFKSRAEYEGRIEGYVAPMVAGGFLLRALKIPSAISKMPTGSKDKKADVRGSQNSEPKIRDGIEGYRASEGVNDLLINTKIPSDELYKYLKGVDSASAELYLKSGKWPEDIQIPKNPSVLKADGSINWNEVPNGGYVLNSSGNAIKKEYVPKIGEIIDRYGPSNGRYTSPVIDGKPYSYDQRSLPYVQDASKYHQYEIKGNFNDIKSYVERSTDVITKIKVEAYMKKYRLSYDDLKVQKGEIASGFGSKGGGVQYELPLPVDMLESLGIIEKVK